MSFIDLAKKRYSVRNYKKQTVEKEKLELVLTAAQNAPSAVNFQPWHFVVIQDKEKLKEICTTYGKPWLQSAPAIIVVCGDHNISWRRADGKDHCDIDIAIAIDHLTLQATELGLGTCWVCMFNAFAMSQILTLPKGMEAIAIIPIGYPDDEPSPRHLTRKPLKEIVHWETF